MRQVRLRPARTGWLEVPKHSILVTLANTRPNTHLKNIQNSKYSYQIEGLLQRIFELRMSILSFVCFFNEYWDECWRVLRVLNVWALPATPPVLV